MARPTKYNKYIQEQADWYVNGGYAELGAAIPSVAGLAVYLDLDKDTIYAWRDKRPQFSDTLKKLTSMQESVTLNGGLKSDMNPHICKLVLANHGYGDSHKLDHRSSDGSMKQPNQIKLVAPEDGEED